MRQRFLLVKKSVRGHKNYYAKIWNKDTHRYTWKSVGAIKDELGSNWETTPHTSKAGASALVQAWIKENPKLTTSSDEPLADYMLTFWTEDSAYIKNNALKGKKYSTAYLNNNMISVRKYFVPFLLDQGYKTLSLRGLNIDIIEKFNNFIAEKTEISASRKNSILKAIKVPLAYAFKRRKIKENIGDFIILIQEEKIHRQIFSLEEFRTFFSIPQKDLRFYGINLLAASTGMRLGECRGLLFEDVEKDNINIKNNWQDEEGLKPPKWGSNRAVYLPASVSLVLYQLIQANPYGGPFVFYGTSADKPIGKKDVSTNFNTTVAEMGIDDKNRKERGLTFHSWRHFYTSMLRGKVPDHVLPRSLGHSTIEMTDRYTSMTEEQRKQISIQTDNYMEAIQDVK